MPRTSSLWEGELYRDLCLWLAHCYGSFCSLALAVTASPLLLLLLDWLLLCLTFALLCCASSSPSALLFFVALLRLNLAYLIRILGIDFFPFCLVWGLARLFYPRAFLRFSLIRQGRVLWQATFSCCYLSLSHSPLNPLFPPLLEHFGRSVIAKTMRNYKCDQTTHGPTDQSIDPSKSALQTTKEAKSE